MAFVYPYAITIYKSRGSEFPAVVPLNAPFVKVDITGDITVTPNGVS
jgi:hypothetical protein